MASLSDKIKNTGYMASELREIGMSSPPNNAPIDPVMMGAASPVLRSIARVNTTDSQAAAAKCRTYSGFSGLRQLQVDQKNNTFYDPGCGWMYKQESGATNPSVNRGVFATYNGVPVEGRSGQPDEIRGGSITMDLQLAEQKAAQIIAAKLNNTCANMQNLTSQNANFFGYCKTTNKIIPIDMSSGTAKARFNNEGNIAFSCPANQIVPASAGPGACPPATQAFRNRSEGFDNSDSLQSQSRCQIPLTRECLIQGVKNAGCTDQGTLLTALSSSGGPGQPYDKDLQTSEAYRYYLSKVNIPNSLLQTGGGVQTSQAAYDIFNALAQTANAPTTDPGAQGQYAAAKDLCLQKNFFKDTYNFCAELTPTAMVNATNIECLQNLWRNAGGASKGTAYPTLSTWTGKNVAQFITFRDEIIAKTSNADKSIQAAAIQQFIGTETYGEVVSVELVRNANTRGSEVMWFYTGNTNTPVLIRSDLMMAGDTDVIPTLKGELINSYGLPANNNMAMVCAFEVRPPTNSKLALKATVSDGFMVGYNQNPFEGTNNMDWGSWKTQSSVNYQSGIYNINTTDAAARNTFVVKYFNGAQGACRFGLALAEDASSPTNFRRTADPTAEQNIYLTQEPLAPWLQFEVCARPNEGRSSALGFFESRFNGPLTPTNQGKSSFDTSFTSIVYQTNPQQRIGVPGTKPYASFTSGSRWATNSMFAYSAFKTITLMIRPISGSQTSLYSGIFSHGQNPSSANARGCNLYLRYANGTYNFSLVTVVGSSVTETLRPCTANVWNLVVIQYIDTDGYGIRGISMRAAPYTTLFSSPPARTEFMNQMKTDLNTNSSVVTPVIRFQSDINKYSAKLFLGTTPWPLAAYTTSGSFTGDIAWLHGFRNYMDSDSELMAEVQQKWISRWPVPKFDSSVAAQANMQATVGNNGSVSCDTYCAGVNGRPWNGELPASWNGAECVATSDPAVPCSRAHGSAISCTCVGTGNGWYSGDHGMGPAAFQSPMLPNGMSDSRRGQAQAQGFRNQSTGHAANTKFNPNYAANSERAYVRAQPPKSVASSLFDLFKW